MNIWQNIIIHLWLQLKFWEQNLIFFHGKYAPILVTHETHWKVFIQPLTCNSKVVRNRLGQNMRILFQFLSCISNRSLVHLKIKKYIFFNIKKFFRQNFAYDTWNYKKKEFFCSMDGFIFFELRFQVKNRLLQFYKCNFRLESVIEKNLAVHYTEKEFPLYLCKFFGASCEIIF